MRTEQWTRQPSPSERAACAGSVLAYGSAPPNHSAALIGLRPVAPSARPTPFRRTGGVEGSRRVRPGKGFEMDKKLVAAIERDNALEDAGMHGDDRVTC
ncbi:hypothetical protein [Streptomyces sp. XY332]|uniref:hypothetical protein n=1 Tax=Streptomyces sp. XY332 TaxID=1415561 RepID=UPI00131C4EBA|nr:hypothetical protein [Streptomyces sp. XY332]